MHISFEQNSDEEPQRYIVSNLTSFSESGISINLNFSDPILISQGEVSDKVFIKLLKSYFMQPQFGRRLATVIEDESYLIIEEDIPRQLKAQGDFESL